MLLGITAFNVIILSFILFYAERNQISWSPLFIISVAVIIRILFVFKQPELSDDIYRYLLDGIQLISGNNPYSLPPDSIKVYDKHIYNILKKVNHPDLITIYPPAAQILFGISAFFSKTIISIKFILVVIDIFTCIIIIKILKNINIPSWKSILYAWHPLPVIEIAGSGHIDSSVIFFLSLTLFIIFSKKSDEILIENSKMVFSGITFGCSFMTKLFPIILLPFLLIVLNKKNRIFFISGFIFITVFLFLLFFPDIINIFKTLAVYLNNWEFSNYGFILLKDSLSSGTLARLILLIIFVFISCIMFVLFLRRKNLNIRIFQYMYWLIFMYLLLNPTLHPWYVLSLVFLLPFYTKPEGLVFSWVVFLSYYIQIEYFLTGKWIEIKLFSAMIWLSPIVTFIIIKIITFTINLTKKSFSENNP